MKSERRKFWKVLIFGSFLGIVVLLSVGLASAMFYVSLEDSIQAIGDYNELQDVPFIHLQNFWDMNELPQDQMQILPDEMKEIRCRRKFNILPMQEIGTMYEFTNLSSNNFWSPYAGSDTQYSQSRGVNYAITDFGNLQNEQVEYYQNVGDAKKRIIPQLKFFSSEKEEVRGNRESSISQTQGNDLDRKLDISGNYSTLWHESLYNATYGAMIPDIDGNGDFDVLALTYHYDHATDIQTGKVIVWKGNNRADRYEESVNGNTCSIDAYVLGLESGQEGEGDLDGDGLYDLFIEKNQYNSSTGLETANLIAMKGTDGTHLWDESITGAECIIYPIFMTDIDSDDLDDVIIYEQRFNKSTEIQTINLIAKKGKDGTHLWEQNVIGSDQISYGIWDDLDGDGVFDVIVDVYFYNESTDTKTEKLIILNGKDGTHLWEQSVTGSGGGEYWSCGILFYDVGDLNGDALTDLGVSEFEYNGSKDIRTAKVMAKKGVDGTTLWEQSLAETGQFNCDIEMWWRKGDLDGDSLNDLILIQSKLNESLWPYEEKIDLIAKKGMDGTTLWELSITGRSWGEDIP
jgi:hypothetical protein